MTLNRRVRDCGGGLHGFVIRYDLEGGDDEVAGSTGDVVPGVWIPLVLLRFVLNYGLIAIAVFAEDFLAEQYTSILGRKILCVDGFRLSLHRPS